MIKKICLALILFAFSFGIYACSQPVNYSLNLKADKEEACAGETVQFTTEFIGDQVDVKVSYEIKEGEAYSEISKDGLLTIKADAESGSLIKVVSKTSDKTSNVVTIKVVKKLESIVLSAESNEIVVGNSIVLETVLNPADAKAEEVKYVVVEGQEACSMVNNLLVVNKKAAIDTIIKVKAVSGSVESNVLDRQQRNRPPPKEAFLYHL